MSASLLEQLRAAHEEVERLERATSQIFLLQDQKCGTAGAASSAAGLLKGEKRKRERLRLDWAASDLLERMRESAQKCLRIYEDGDSLRKDEISFLAGQREGSVGNDVWINFYEKIRQIREFHRKRAMVAAAQGTDVNALFEVKDLQAIVEEANQTPYLDGVFDEAEQYGEMLNLHEFFSTFINWKPMRSYKVNEAKKAETARLLKRGLTEEEVAERLKDSRFEEDLIDYISYLKSFHLFSTIPRALKYRSPEYLAYLKAVAAYLRDFFQRRNPLADHEQVQKKFAEQFQEQWAAKEVPGWQTATTSLPLYCRPTDRVFLTEGTKQSHMQGKKYKKALVEFSKLSREEQEKHEEDSQAHDKEIAESEFLVNAYKEILEDVVERTVAYHHKKQSRTAEELEEENQKTDAEEDAAKAVGDAERDSEDEEDDQPVYNPLNLPLGFDGRPIPFWLYKLHGLGQEFKCEICGNFSYWGRRAFERHFMEWRHAFGMRCLRIPNTTHFKEITKIEDAIKLYEKLKKDAEGQTFKDEQELECEDSQGNVMSLRAYEDLRRQGLL
ncbi:putative splicesome-associated protein [Besnoitia besnoiti]|uniref:Putative splicesome-associated protein n=1 Tax=Besnoitia besnoiti TaxID=94643 RepID=A0A2A9MEI7_BESBE|nr:putative splicesome-associated protein [Besnoitia besnoiti]PFH33792.1 putative splicesome-associated protein [Besnoitia besnoiti]